MTDQQPLVGILFSDIEGSTRLWQEHSVAMKSLIVIHDEIVDQSIIRHGGKVIDHAGDGVFAVFEEGDPLGCALDIQQQLQDGDWGEVGELRIRMGLHAGIAQKRGEDYRGPLVNKSARIMGTAWGGQIVFTPALLEHFPLPEGAKTDDLGMHQLKDLDEPVPILGLIHPSLKLKEFPALRSLSQHPNNLPLQNTTFIGRETELEEIAAHFETSRTRLLTLLGPGGMGKTRLALQAAANAIETFPHGVFFVHLAPVESESLVISAIADAFKLSFYPGKDPKEQLLNYLGGKEMLLVIDNMEHLMNTANLLDDILQHAPQLKLLATSRERLNLAEETLMMIEGLSSPPSVNGSGTDAQNSAVQLFVERARQVDAGFALDEDNAPHIRHICELVGGLPLGIELASAWVRMLSCEEIAQEISQEMDFLASNQRNLEDRHRSLRAAFEYSWKLLTPEEQNIFKNLSVLRGSWDKNAAQKISNATLMDLSQLLDKSLIRKTSGSRFFIQEMLRYYGYEKLQEDLAQFEAVNLTHAQHFMAQLQQQSQALRGPQQPKALETVANDLNNISAAWDWAAAEGQWELLEQGLEGLCLYYEKRGQFENGKTDCQHALTSTPALGMVDEDTQKRIRSKLLNRCGFFLYRLNDHFGARAALNEALSLAEDQDNVAEKAYSLNYLGLLEIHAGQRELAQQCLEQSLDLRRNINDPNGIVASLNNLGSLAHISGQFEAARQWFSESLSISKLQGDPGSTAACLSNLGEIERLTGNMDMAKQYANEGLALRESLQDRWGIATSYNNLGILAHTQSDWEVASEMYAKSYQIYADMGERQGMSTTLLNLGVVAFRQGALSLAKEQLEKSLEIRRGLGAPRGVASCLSELGEVELALDNLQNAQACFIEALKIALELNVPAAAFQSLLSITRMWIKPKPEVAIQLLTYLKHHPEKPPAMETKVDELASQHNLADSLNEAPAELMSLSSMVQLVLQHSESK